MSRVYESGQYYQKVKESTNGVERECIEEEKWQRGEPFSESFSLRGLPSQTHSSFIDSFRQSNSPFERNSHSGQSQRLSSFTRHSKPFRFGERFPSQTMRPRSLSSHLDQEPVYSTNNRRTSLHDSSSELFASRSSQPDIPSRPGSPQVVAGAGDIINTEHGFTIELDVKHFRPNDIKVSLSGNTLTVVGDRLHDDTNSAQTLRRTFTRKYSIPQDIQLSSIFSFMTDAGLLIIRGSRKGWKETEISVQVAPSVDGRTRSSVMSVV